MRGALAIGSEGGSAMRYVLDEGFVLRGWEKLPYALVRKADNVATFLSARDFAAIELCDGQIDDALPLFDDQMREALKRLSDAGIVHAAPAGSAQLSPDQRYRRYPNRYISTAHWSITGRCNYRCRHCYMDAPDAKMGELDHEATMEIARQIVECGIGRVSLTGGEPLVRRDFMDIVDYLVGNGVRIVQIYSNGRLVTERLLDELAERGVRPEFNMSYDGDGGWHDWMRGVSGATDDVLRAFDLCREKGFPTGAEMCLHAGNIDLLRQSVNTLAAHGCSSLKTNPISLTELWLARGEGNEIPLEQLLEAYLGYIPAYFEDGMPLTIQLGGVFACRKGSLDWFIPQLHPLCADKGSDEANGDFLSMCICGHARQTLYISPEGRMLPCMPLSSVPAQEGFPLVQDAGLAAGLTDSAYMDLITATVADYFEHNPECAACEHRFQCAGGCRGSALLDGSDDLMGRDPAMCLLYRGGYAERVREAASAAVAAKAEHASEDGANA